MNTAKWHGRTGFTLVELMTVIAIIVLLIGILIPSLSAARKHAKDASTAGLLSGLEKGCELFKTELNRYPVSRGPNPFEDDGSSNVPLAQGAQWLAMQLVGVDSRGFVDYKDLKNDSYSHKDGVIDKDDWNEWYSLQPDRAYSRLGPYVPAESSENIRSVRSYLEEHPELGAGAAANLIPAELTDDTNDWSLEFLPFFVDAWEFPVLYYRANPNTDAPFTTGTPGSNFNVGRYDQSDNALFTGGDGNDGRWPVQSPGWDLTGTGRFPYPKDNPGAAHPLADFGYRAKQMDWPLPQTFAEFFCDEAIYGQTQRGSSGGCLWPYNADSLILISAGKDGEYGTGDDITNFRSGGGR